jgi:hypothetical protein
MDSLEGYIPQQCRRIIVKPIGPNIIISLYALGLHATEGDISKIAQLNSEDISLFNEMVATLKFP